MAVAAGATEREREREIYIQLQIVTCGKDCWGFRHLCVHVCVCVCVCEGMRVSLCDARVSVCVCECVCPEEATAMRWLNQKVYGSVCIHKWITPAKFKTIEGRERETLPWPVPTGILIDSIHIHKDLCKHEGN